MPVEVLFSGGAVFTGTGKPIEGLVVGIAGGRITAVRPEAEMDGLIGPETRVIDLAGALLSPGFQDAHIHPVSGGTEMLQCNLTEAESAEEAVQLIAEYAEANPDEPWIVGAGWSMDHFEGGSPLRGTIDAVVSDRPVYLFNRDHHGVWVNTKAIELGGLSADTPDPVDGRIEREPDGYPAGTLHEGAGDLFNSVLPEITPELRYRGLLRAQEDLVALGVTGWQDAIIGEDLVGEGAREAYERALAEGTLKARVVGAQWWLRDQGLEQIEKILKDRDEVAALGHPDRFSLGTVKIMVDGVAENYTASMLEPYLDASGCATHNHGISFVDPEMLTEAVQRLDAEGMQVHFHALGDRAVRNALDAVQAAREANGPSNCRHHLAHLQMIAEDDSARFAELDAIANLQMLWATHEDQLDRLTLPFLPDGAVNRHYPFGELVDKGARLAAGSDWPVSSADPIAAIHIGVTRQDVGVTEGPLGGDAQRLSLETALAAYTSGSAYVNHREHSTGSIAEGYLADLIVIEPNPFTLDPADLWTAKVRETWIDGERVYARDE